jgi:hypothetical protein
MARPVLTFRTAPECSGIGRREIAVLGEVEIGEVIVGCFSDKIGAFWLVRLPPSSEKKLNPARTPEAARGGLIAFVSEWLRQTGCIYGDQRVATAPRDAEPSPERRNRRSDEDIQRQSDDLRRRFNRRRPER